MKHIVKTLISLPRLIWVFAGCTGHFDGFVVLRLINLFLWVLNLYVTAKAVFRVCDQVRLKPACSATETSYSLEILDLASIYIILSKQRTTKALIRLHVCAFVVRIWHKTGFLMMRLNSTYILLRSKVDMIYVWLVLEDREHSYCLSENRKRNNLNETWILLKMKTKENEASLHDDFFQSNSYSLFCQHQLHTVRFNDCLKNCLCQNQCTSYLSTFWKVDRGKSAKMTIFNWLF